MPMSEEHKARMREGRRKAAEARRAAGIKLKQKRENLPTANDMRGILKPEPHVARETTEFIGITKADCPVDCTIDRCIITGAACCGHPAKGALQPAYMINPQVQDRYNRARKQLLHADIEQRS